MVLGAGFTDANVEIHQPATPTERQPNPLPRAKQGNFRVLVYGK